MRSIKYKTLLYLSKTGIRHRLDGPMSDCKSVCVLQRALPKSSWKFEQIPGNSNQRLDERSVARDKTRAIRKWELNTCNSVANLGTEGFFVDRRRSEIHTM